MSKQQWEGAIMHGVCVCVRACVCIICTFMKFSAEFMALGSSFRFVFVKSSAFKRIEGGKNMK
jgi:hypothetical protein